jgi:Domain of Unknown Function with PDB structure (DUF3863)/Domain of Unknown Function with PDB structure (DUF3864)/Domain of Unknown Function (DUF1080)
MKHYPITFCFAAIFTMVVAVAAPKPEDQTWTDPAIALREDPDFAIQGEYRSAEGATAFGAQVVALGQGSFDIYLLDGGLPGAGWEPGKSRTRVNAAKKDGTIFGEDATSKTTVALAKGTLSVTMADGTKHALTRIERSSPTLSAKPPEGAVVLFDGSTAEKWDKGKMENGHLLATGCSSKEQFDDYTLHVEFRTPYKPFARSQKRGNSGIYLNSRWETQILDSFGLDGKDNECGGVYSVSKPRLNMCLPPLTWQTYDIDFTAAKFDAEGKRISWPRITVRLNGVVVHEDRELQKDFTAAAPISKPLETAKGPVFLQDHGNPVVFRNIWLLPKKPEPVKQTSQLMGKRFLTLNTIVRVRQIEVTREEAHGPDESSVHTPAEAKIFREAIDAAWPGARITWAFSWLALHDERETYRELRELIVSYHKKFGDEITFLPGAYFSNMYNTREQVNKDLHEGLQRVSAVVGNGYRPNSIVAGFLSAANLRYLAEVEGIHVCQGNIWSQYAVDNGDGEGSIAYPYYPSREHFCKPAQGKNDFIDCVNLDGWTVDFLCARIPGAKMVNGERWRSRQGVGPIETLLDMGTERGTQAMLATTASHFDDGFARNGFAWVTCGWEMSLVEARKIYGYGGRNGMEGLTRWLTEIRKRWPEAQLITQGEFGLLWREHFKDNAALDYQFVHRGAGIRASQEELEIRWFMNKDFRLALLRDWKQNGAEKVIDFTRYDLPASEPADPEPGKNSRNWSLMNRINQKGTRPQDAPVSLRELPADEQALIRKHYPELLEK